VGAGSAGVDLDSMGECGRRLRGRDLDSMGSVLSAGYHTGVALEPILAAVVTLVGIGLTSGGVFAHTGTAVAPGALLLFVGGGWLGTSLARRDVRLLPGSRAIERRADGEVARS
jgi:hypothetical protein